ncbi:ABC-2 family transporter protein [Peptoclostridium litorale DSM 5388]|uniref:Putative Abc transporter, permease protein n=1 Tax=Peptoclostridium litorale DSM 5388 TaxID=1121324 RepID=A0A069RIZ8_PEPLI|nr:ABC transporter permease [Peptoclostridium litorale]KDR96778.1 putative Abc transporter, permease protein [Peptoclostridium litorale DSM 5388]SIO34495.1 ABC-2 family transporter protein [Peptoclostridium litorale DSM 5388]
MSTIIRLTLLEMLKKKILYITMVLTMIFMILYGTALHFAYESLPNEDLIVRLAVSSQLLSMGIYASSFIISFLSIFASVGAISSEIEQGTYDAVLSKPISRTEVLLGKFFGIIGILIPYLLLLIAGILGLNMFFAGDASASIPSSSIAGSFATMCILPVFLASMGIFLSTFMPTVASGVIMVLLYFCAMVGGVLEKIAGFMQSAGAKTALTNIGIGTSLVMPSDIIYRKASSLLFTTASGLNLSAEGMLGVSSQPSKAMMIYIGGYVIVLLITALGKFKVRDL